LEKIEMKKTLVAVAALAAVAGAHAEATISGVLDAAVTVSGSTATLGSGPNGGSEITAAVKEDLGGGVSAMGSISLISAMTSNAASTATIYNSFVGFGGDFGSIKLGSQTSPIFNVSTISDVTGRWNSGGLANPSELWNAQSITYTSPSISGVTLGYQRQLGATTNDSDATNNTGGGTAEAFSIQFATGGFSAGYGYSSDTANGSSSLFAASYDFGVAKVTYGALMTDVISIGTNVTSNQIGVSIPVGAATLFGQFSADSASNSAQSYGVMYALSKRTMLYADNTYNVGTVANARTPDGTTTFRLGVKHAF